MRPPTWIDSIFGFLSNAWEMIGRRIGLPCDCKAFSEFSKRNTEGEMTMKAVSDYGVETIFVYFCPFCGRRV